MEKELETKTNESSTYALTTGSNVLYETAPAKCLDLEQEQSSATTEQMADQLDDDVSSVVSTAASTSLIPPSVGLVQMDAELLRQHLQQIQEMADDDDDDSNEGISTIFRIKLPRDAMASEVSDIMRKFEASQVSIHTKRGKYEVYNETTDTKHSMGLFDGYYFPPSFSDIVGEQSEQEDEGNSEQKPVEASDTINNEPDN
jgi:hypothetical protein